MDVGAESSLRYRGDYIIADVYVNFRECMLTFQQLALKVYVNQLKVTNLVATHTHTHTHTFMLTRTHTHTHTHTLTHTLTHTHTHTHGNRAQFYK